MREVSLGTHVLPTFDHIIQKTMARTKTSTMSMDSTTFINCLALAFLSGTFLRVSNPVLRDTTLIDLYFLSAPNTIARPRTEFIELDSGKETIVGSEPVEDGNEGPGPWNPVPG
jgi:hypothetical protein